MARLVALQRPEAGGIRGEHFVAQHHVAVLIQTKLKLGVGNDDAAGERIFSTLLIQGNGVVAQLGGVLLAVAGELLFQHLDALFVGDVLVVVADLGLGGGSVDRLGQLVGLLQALGQLNAAHLAGLLVAGPAAAGDVAAHDALNGQHGQLTAHHAVAVELGLLEELRHILHVHAQHMVGQQIAGVIEPEFAHLGQNGALFGDLVFQDDIKRGNAVGSNHDEAVTVIIDLTNLAFFNGLELSHNQTLHFPMPKKRRCILPDYCTMSADSLKETE